MTTSVSPRRRSGQSDEEKEAGDDSTTTIFSQKGDQARANGRKSSREEEGTEGKELGKHAQVERKNFDSALNSTNRANTRTPINMTHMTNQGARYHTKDGQSERKFVRRPLKSS